MKAWELIEKLRCMDPNQEVVFYCGGDEWSASTMARLEFVKPVPGHRGRYVSASITEGGLPLVVGL